MNRKVVALLVGATLTLGVAGCGDATVAGTLVAKEHEPRNCDKSRKGKCQRWDPEEYELTIRQSDGTEVELVVKKAVYDAARVNSTGRWKGTID